MLRGPVAFLSSASQLACESGVAGGLLTPWKKQRRNNSPSFNHRYLRNCNSPGSQWLPNASAAARLLWPASLAGIASPGAMEASQYARHAAIDPLASSSVSTRPRILAPPAPMSRSSHRPADACHSAQRLFTATPGLSTSAFASSSRLVPLSKRKRPRQHPARKHNRKYTKSPSNLRRAKYQVHH